MKQRRQRKKHRRNRLLLAALASVLIGISLALLWSAQPGRASQAPEPALLLGNLRDSQGQPVPGAEVLLRAEPEGAPLAEATSQLDGSYTLAVPESLPPKLLIDIQRPHFQDRSLEVDVGLRQRLRDGFPVVIPEIVLERRIGIAFFIAALVFAGMLALIALDKLHNTLAALLGASVVLTVSYLGRPLWKDLFIMDFHNAVSYIDWNVIFLIMGMMIVIAVTERTGIFQWLAYTAYRISGGRAWVLVPILMIITGVASALLDNVTTMLLMTPLTVQIALVMGISPLALLMPEVMSSNIAGISTLIGTPTNILIGSYADISFADFLTNQTPGVLLAMIGLILYVSWVYRSELRQASDPEVSGILLEKLAERSKITEPAHLKKAGWVGLAMLVMFVFGENLHLLPAVTALVGATALLLWVQPDIEEMIEAVDWTTLVFFMALFINVGAIQEVGLISMIASAIGDAVGGSLILTMLTIIWVSAIFSAVVDNIPFAAAMLPVVGYLTGIVPGAQSKALFYCLSVGAAMGGNGSLIGSSPNMVTAGISERAGYPITYSYFFKKGFPVMLITVALASIWLVIRFHALE